MQEVFEKIIEKLEEKIVITWKHDYDGGRKDAFNEAIKIVKQEAEQYNNGWITCSEPPKYDRYVLLSFDNFSVPMVGRYEEDEKGGSYYIGDEMEPCVTQDIFVNAWQPLPEPYQPNGE